MITLGALCAHIPPGSTLEEFEAIAHLLIGVQKGILWQIGDVALDVESQHPDTHDQVWPAGASLSLIERCKGVAKAYPPDDRNPDANFTIHSFHTKNPDRVRIVQAIAEAGMTSDEARKSPPPIVEPEPAVVPPEPAAPAENNGWLLAVDVNYYAHRMFSKAGPDTAVQVCEWFERLIDRLQINKGLTDVVFCFDDTTNHRRALTDGWEQPYKERTIKDPELVIQLQEIPRLLQSKNFACVSIKGMEADDVMASYAKQFPGRVTLMTADKDLRQCLSAKCNILRDMEWETNESTGALIQVYKWIMRLWKPPKDAPDKEKPDNIECHMTDVINYFSAAVKGISPELWPHFQAIAGDSTDDITGCVGIGGKLAMDLILNHGTVQGVIDACKDGTATVFDSKTGEPKPLSKIKIQSVLNFEEFAETTLLLTTMRTDLDVPMVTKLSMKETT